MRTPCTGGCTSWSRRSSSLSRGYPAGDVPLQARPDPGRGLSVAAQEYPPAAPSAHRSGAGITVPGHRRDPTRAAGAPLPRPASAQAIPYWQTAGQRAAQRSAPGGGWPSYHRGGAAPDSTGHAGTHAPGPAASCRPRRLAHGRERPSGPGGGTRARARTLCQQVGDTPQLFPVLRGSSCFT